MMQRVVFEVVVEAKTNGMTDTEEEENIVSCILDSLGFPESVNVRAKLLRRESV